MIGLKSNFNVVEKKMQDYFLEHGVQTESGHWCLLLDCIQFWSDTPIEKMEEIVCEQENNLYTDMAIMYDTSIGGIKKNMGYAFSTNSPTTHQLNCFIIGGVKVMQKMESKEPSEHLNELIYGAVEIVEKSQVEDLKQIHSLSLLIQDALTQIPKRNEKQKRKIQGL